MSYDLYLFQPESGTEPLVTAERLFLEEGDEGEDSELYDLKELARLLIEFKPELEVYPPTVREAIEGTSTKQDVQGYESIEFTDPDNDYGIQVSLYNDEVVITIPYWHRGETARIAFEEIWGYLQLLEREAGLRAFDPQVGEVLDLENDLALVLEGYQGTIRQMGEVLGACGPQGH